MIKKNFEVWRYSQSMLSVMVKSPHLFNKLQNEYRAYPHDARYLLNDEPVFRVPEVGAKRLWALLGVQEPPVSL